LLDSGWIWLPIALAAAAAQTVRNAAQRSLVKSVGTLAATLVRFIYGLPFAACALAMIGATGSWPLPHAHAAFVAWVSAGALAQLAATALLIGAMERRSFVVAVAFSKTEILQVALYSILLLGEALSLPVLLAIVVASAGVVLLSVLPAAERGDAPRSWLSPVAALGLGSGAGFALSAVGYRAAALALDYPVPWVVGVYGLVWAQTLQSLVLGGYLAWRDRAGLLGALAQWRVSALAGFMGALASTGWLTAFAMRSAVDVRMVGLVEVIYSYALSRRLFVEAVTRREAAGILLVVCGIVAISTLR
jgi:drug/metabolite transporter (DMT)-like permease